MFRSHHFDQSDLRWNMSEIAFTLDGTPQRASAGMTIAAALFSIGVRSWRTTRVNGSPRGLFCGMGACYDCLITVNGQPNIRACLVAINDGDAVLRQKGTGHE
jgi:aerobic-type carbon monoxide dehydrogenase small subunit (CoxS/CutS family)